MNFDDPTAPTATYSSTSYDAIQIGRYLPNTSDSSAVTFYGFDRAEFTTADRDVPSYAKNAGTLDNYTFYMALYVVSYGLDPTSFVNLYSAPQYLGYIQLFSSSLVTGGTS